jgi:hypothetical protein
MDTQFPSNPKVLELVAQKKWRALFVLQCSWAYAGQHGTGGFIGELSLPCIHATKAEAETLVSAGFWDMVPGGWDIHDWDEKQVSDEAARKRRERAQKGGLKRAENARKAHLHGI